MESSNALPGWSRSKSALRPEGCTLMDSFTTALHAARSAAVADSLRALLGMAVEDEPDVVSIRVQATHQSAGLSVVEWELVGASGHSIGGGAL